MTRLGRPPQPTYGWIGRKGEKKVDRLLEGEYERVRGEDEDTQIGTTQRTMIHVAVTPEI